MRVTIAQSHHNQLLQTAQLGARMYRPPSPRDIPTTSCPGADYVSRDSSDVQHTYARFN